MRALILYHRDECEASTRKDLERDAARLNRTGVEARVEEIDAPMRGPSGSAGRRNGIYDQVLEFCGRHGSEVVHMCGYWQGHCLTAHAAAHASGAVTVQEWRDFRPLCAGGWFVRPSGRPCHECLEKSAWRGAIHGCSGLGLGPSAALARVIEQQRRSRAWHDAVDAYLVANRKMKDVYVRAGFPQENMQIRPWAVEDPGAAERRPRESMDFLCVDTLIDRDCVEAVLIAWGMGAGSPEARLLIAGDGPARRGLMQQAYEMGLQEDTVVFLGRLEREAIRRLMGESRACIVPGLQPVDGLATIGEAFAHGRAVVVARNSLGSEWVEDGVHGFTVPAGDAQSMADALALLASNGELANRMGAEAREAYLKNDASAGAALAAIYRSVVQQRYQRTRPVRAGAAAGGA